MVWFIIIIGVIVAFYTFKNNNSTTKENNSLDNGNSNKPPKINDIQDALKIIESEKYFNKATELFKKRDYISAIRFYEKAGALGDKDALYQLGNAYLQGQGVIQNFDKAYENYLKSANLNHEKAQYNIGLFYLQGQILEKNIDVAKKWLEKSSKNGYIEATKVLDQLKNKNTRHEYKVEPLGEKQIQAMLAGAKKLDKDLGRTATFEDLIQSLIKQSTYTQVDNLYNSLIEGWKAIGRDVSNVEEVYDKYFNTEKNHFDCLLTPFTQSKPNQNENAEEKTENFLIQVLVKRLEKVMFEFTYSEEINSLCKDMFVYCLDKSNKNVTFEEITSVYMILENRKYLLYIPLFEALNEILSLSYESLKQLQVNNKSQIAFITFKDITNNTISEINKI